MIDIGKRKLLLLKKYLNFKLLVKEKLESNIIVIMIMLLLCLNFGKRIIAVTNKKYSM